MDEKRRIPDDIRGVVRAGQPGAYLLGYGDVYVGRSDTCLRTRLIAHELMYEVEYFACCFTPDVRRSFLQECEFWRSKHGHFRAAVMTSRCEKRWGEAREGEGGVSFQPPNGICANHSD